MHTALAGKGNFSKESKWRLIRKIRHKKIVSRRRGMVCAVFVGVFLLSCFLLWEEAFADGFYPGADTEGCSMASVMAIQYADLGDASLFWDQGLVQGESSPWIQGSEFKTIASPWYPNASRYNNVADYVSVPPRTIVDFGIFFWNHSGHTIDVRGIDLYTSLDNLTDGDLTKLGANGTQKSSCFNQGGVWKCRNSKVKEASVNWSVQDRHVSLADTAGRVFYSFETIQPIIKKSFQAIRRWVGRTLFIDYQLVLKNNSSYDSCNINVYDILPSGEVYNQDHCISAGAEKVIVYSANMGDRAKGNIFNDGARVKDNNYRVEKNSYPGSYIHDRTPVVLPAIFSRNDSTNVSWTAMQPVWGEMGRGLTVQLIPYGFYTEGVSSEGIRKVLVNYLASDSDENQSTEIHSDNEEEITFDLSLTNLGDFADIPCVLVEFPYGFMDLIDYEGGEVVENKLKYCINSFFHGDTVNYTIKAKIKNLDEGVYRIESKVCLEDDQNNCQNVYVNVDVKSNIVLELTVLDTDETGVFENTIDVYNDGINNRDVLYELRYSNIGNGDFKNAVVKIDLTEWFGGEIGFLDNIEIIEILPYNGWYDAENSVILLDIESIRRGESGVLSCKIRFNVKKISVYEVENFDQGDDNLFKNVQIRVGGTILGSNGNVNSNAVLTNLLSPFVLWEKKQLQDHDSVQYGISDKVKYVVTLKNIGDGSLFELKLKDLFSFPLPETLEGFTIEGLEATNCNLVRWEDDLLLDERDIFSCYKNILGPGESVNITYSIKIPEFLPNGENLLTNTATIVAYDLNLQEITLNLLLIGEDKFELKKFFKRIGSLNNSKEEILSICSASESLTVNDENTLQTYDSRFNVDSRGLYCLEVINFGSTVLDNSIIVDDITELVAFGAKIEEIDENCSIVSKDARTELHCNIKNILPAEKFKTYFIISFDPFVEFIENKFTSIEKVSTCNEIDSEVLGENYYLISNTAVLKYKSLNLEENIVSSDTIFKLSCRPIKGKVMYETGTPINGAKLSYEIYNYPQFSSQKNDCEDINFEECELFTSDKIVSGEIFTNENGIYEIPCAPFNSRIEIFLKENADENGYFERINEVEELSDGTDGVFPKFDFLYGTKWKSNNYILFTGEKYNCSANKSLSLDYVFVSQAKKGEVLGLSTKLVKTGENIIFKMSFAATMLIEAIYLFFKNIQIVSEP